MATRTAKLRPITEIVASRQPTNGKQRVVAVVVLIAYVALLFAATHINLSGTILDTKNNPGELKLVEVLFHFGSYSVLTFLLILTMTKSTVDESVDARIASAKRLVISCCVVIVYAIVDEATQPYFGRNFEFVDLLCNIFGVAAGQLTFIVFEASGWRAKMDRM